MNSHANRRFNTLRTLWGRRLTGFSVLALALALLLGLATTVNASSVLRLTFGVYQSEHAAKMYNKFKPVIESLERDLSLRLNRSVRIELSIIDTYENGIRAISNGDIDFSRVGPASYVISKSNNPGISLLAMETEKGQKRFKGLIVVKSKSPFKTLADLRGHSFAFGDRESTIGRFLSQAALVDAGIRATDLANYSYLGRHDLVFTAVESGNFDAGALQESTFEKMNDRGALRVIHEFDNVTKPWIARANLAATVTTAIRDALLNTKDEKILTALGASGFTAATNADYGLVREGMLRAQQFEPAAVARTPTTP